MPYSLAEKKRRSNNFKKRRKNHEEKHSKDGRSFLSVILVFCLSAGQIGVLAAEKRTVLSSCDFESYEAGTKFTENSQQPPLTDGWNVDMSWEPENHRMAAVAAEEGNQFLDSYAYLVLKSKYCPNSAYELKADIRQKAEGFAEYLAGIFLHAAEDWGAYNSYCDWDNYSEKGGASTISKGSFIGFSGIIVVPAKDQLRIYVKTYETDGISNTERGYGVGSDYVELPLGLDGSARFWNLTILDDGSTITVQAEGNTLATISLEGKGKYDKGTEYDYYKTVTIRNAEGTELLKKTNALATVSAQSVIATRGMTPLQLDNLKLTAITEESEIPETGDNGIVWVVLISLGLVLPVLRRGKKTIAG